jgi:hypothetical protein
VINILVKCNWCNEKHERESMICEEKSTGKFNKNGSEKMTRKYFHSKCHTSYLDDKKFKEKELTTLDALYKYLLILHDVESLDPRQMEKIQDLRNGTIKVNNRKIVKYKSGVPYELMLITYKHLEDRIDQIMKTMQFETKWNEFSYIFGTMQNNLNDVNVLLKRKRKEETTHENLQKIKAENNLEEIKVETKIIRRDDLDISNFL